MRILVLSVVFLFAGTWLCSSRQFDGVAVGAQVFIEPGQTDTQIDSYFRTLHRSGMKVARIRLFGVHVMHGDRFDFSLYDKAFDCAEKYGIQLFVTLFPPTDELSDVGGFKFPRSKRHLEEIDRYITAVVSHYKDHPALNTWVLQNEPGYGRPTIPENDLAAELFAEFLKDNPRPDREDGYLKADFTDEKFVMWYTAWYLSHISETVVSIDPIHGRHVNPHKILAMLTDYDFRKYEKFLTSLGASMHFSWHFNFFNRKEYAEGVSIMSDVIRSAAGSNPFWVTELQGGNVTASGDVPYCPSADDIIQYMWTAAGSGADGIIFWTLNARAAANEAGEWAMLDYQGHPTDRLKAASEVAGTFTRLGKRLKDMSPYISDVTILYNVESLWTQKRNSSLISSGGYGRQSDAVMRSVTAAYQAFARGGVTPEVKSMDRFDWEDGAGKVAVMPHCITCPSPYIGKIKEFVSSGGKLILTGLSCFYDEYMRCLFMGDFPLEECFGAELSEFKVAGEYFSLENGLRGHLWKGYLRPSGAETVLEEDGGILCTRNRFGKGEVLWLPVPVELGAYGDSAAMKELWDFYSAECVSATLSQPIRFVGYHDGVLMRVMESESEVLSIIINRNDEEVGLELLADGLTPEETVWGNDDVSDGILEMKPGNTSVIIWKK